VRASGDDAAAAVAAIVDLVKRDFDEAGDHGAA
jgi:phosphotransferase system HPr-like phosphotransfer protein